jgi:NADPH:quinone reductase-like Zn-dependent oxidoreductase
MPQAVVSSAFGDDEGSSDEVQMRCAIYDPAAKAGVRVAQKPAPKRAEPKGMLSAGSVICEVHAAGVNPVDAKYVIGDKLPEARMEWASRIVSGMTPGFDFSGVVITAPAGCGFAPGDEVFGLAADPTSIARGYMHGAFAQVVSAPLDQIAKKPATLSHREAAALPLVGTTALQAFEQHGLAKGQRLLVLGASGGVGHVAVQVARVMGAHVVAVCSGANGEWVAQCGAQTVLDYRDGDVFAKLAAEGAKHSSIASHSIA